MMTKPPPRRLTNEEWDQTIAHAPLARDEEPIPPRKFPPWIMDSNGRMIYTQSGDAPWEPTLTPGAYLAKQRGCTCSRLDNKWGEGNSVYLGEDELGGHIWDLEYSIQPGCPLHDLTNRNEDQRQDETSSDPRPMAEQSPSDH